MSQECILCYENCEIFTISQCNHGPICCNCTIKCRTVLKNKECPICKMKLNNIILSYEFRKYEEIDLKSVTNFKDDIYYLESEIKQQLNQMNQNICQLCNQIFNTIGVLKKHLKEKHFKYICELCNDNKAALLSEQKLFTKDEYNNHLYQGEVDKFGNTFFLHPYCDFCDQYFYNEDQFGRHLTQDHFNCQICGDQEKYLFYNKYSNLQKHFKISHYICNHQSCLDKNYIVFATKGELELHRAQEHSNISVNMKFMNQIVTGFHYGAENQQKEEKMVVKDKEGIDFKNQFLSLKENNIQNFEFNQENQIDQKLDIRLLYKQKYAGYNFEKYLKNIFTMLKGKQSYKKEKDEILLIKYCDIEIDRYLITQLFQAYLQTNYIGQSTLNQLSGQLLQKVINESQFFYEFITTFGDKFTIYFFPFYLKTVPYPMCENLDQSYFQYMIRQFNEDIFIKKSLTYKGLFANLSKKILKLLIDNEFKLKLEKAQFIQYLLIIKKLNLQDMASIQFGSNFGISIDTLNDFKKNVYTSQKAKLALNEIDDQDLNKFYIYFKVCEAVIDNCDIYNSKQIQNKLYNNILQTEGQTIEPQQQQKTQSKGFKDQNQNWNETVDLRKQKVMKQSQDQDFPNLIKKDLPKKEVQQIKENKPVKQKQQLQKDFPSMMQESQPQNHQIQQKQENPVVIDDFPQLEFQELKKKDPVKKDNRQEFKNQVIEFRQEDIIKKKDVIEYDIAIKQKKKKEKKEKKPKEKNITKQIFFQQEDNEKFFRNDKEEQKQEQKDDNIFNNFQDEDIDNQKMIYQKIMEEQNKLQEEEQRLILEEKKLKQAQLQQKIMDELVEEKKNKKIQATQYIEEKKGIEEWGQPEQLKVVKTIQKGKKQKQVFQGGFF